MDRAGQGAAVNAPEAAPEATPLAALQAVDLAKSYGTVEAVKGISFTLERGRSLAMVGPDGAGKTTTMRMLCGLLRPDRGSVRIFGAEPRQDDAKRRIGYLSQRFSLYADLSIDENIAFFAQIHGVGDFKNRRNRLLDVTALTRFRKRPAGKLSGGMKQKLALACALVHEPEILLLDEPTTGVDPIARREFWEILGGLLGQGMSLVVTTPYMDEAERCAEVALVSRGSVLAAGTPGELKTQLPYSVLELPCADARRTAALLSMVNSVASVQAYGDRVALLCDDPERTAGVALSILGAAGIPHGEGRVAPPSLENLFVHLLGSEAHNL